MALSRIHCGEIELRLLHKDHQDRVVDIFKIRVRFFLYYNFLL